MNLIPWRGNKTSTELATVEEKIPSEIVIRSAKKGTDLIEFRSKEVMIAGKKVKVSPDQLIRLVKRVTQNIGEYKGQDDIYSAIVCGAMRRARADLVNILEEKFNVHWQIDPQSGESIFYMG